MIEDTKGIVERAFSGPHPVKCAFVGIEQNRPVTIDLYETGQKIKKACQEHEYTVRRLHEELNIRVQSVYAWFAGNAAPSLENMYQLSSLFKIPMEQMIAEPPQMTGFRVYVGKTDKDRTAKVMWKYYVMELRRCMAENTWL